MTNIDIIWYVDRMALRHRNSYWWRGVTMYARELCDNLPSVFDSASGIDLLNGARDWHDYSWDGCSLIYDCDIAARLCTPSEYRRKRGGELKPNRTEEWLDVQARALTQAALLVRKALFLWEMETVH